MLDPEFRTLLKEEYGFRENHLILLSHFMSNKKKKLSAESLWTETEVPKGRIYEFLNDLVDWGFLEVEYKKPKTYSILNLKEALQNAISRKERKLTETEKKTLEMANKIEKSWRTEVGEKTGSIQIISSPEEFYIKAREMLMDSTEAKVSERTPLLFLSTERNSTWRRRTYESMIDMTEAKRLDLKYIFSLENIIKIASENENADEVINSLKDSLENGNLTCRYVAGTGIESMLIVKDRALLGIVSPKSGSVENGLYTESKEMVDSLHKMYDLVFDEAETLGIKTLQILGKALEE
ncbi:MAG: helix-turn-helix domain-containing protein [archaeon]|jgi:sugar-specific transcriptional regulator TrmB|nr:helix-turn-helix domain-containing protein [archaeon]|tara:strand:- start:11638 stop:12522 length:885 start_codon:yes stop_codon:yes gene_type:complete